VHKSTLATHGSLFPQVINLGRLEISSFATCGFNKNPQITTLLTTTNFINTKSGE
jgi:hypothetical protein